MLGMFSSLISQTFEKRGFSDGGEGDSFLLLQFNLFESDEADGGRK